MVSKISLAFAIGLSSFQAASAQNPAATAQPESAAQTETAIEAKAGSATKDWMNWRGPAYNGSSKQTGLPHALSEKQLQWKIELPGTGCSTPIVVEDSVYLTSPGKWQRHPRLC